MNKTRLRLGRYARLAKALSPDMRRNRADINRLWRLADARDRVRPLQWMLAGGWFELGPQWPLLGWDKRAMS